MKIRTGFVSNSSSSSFVCWGVSIDEIEITDKLWLSMFERERTTNQEKALKEVLENDEYKQYFENVRKEALSWLEKTENLVTDVEKTTFIKNSYNNDNEEFFDNYQGKMEGLSVGGNYNFHIGLTPNILERDYSEIKFGEVREIVAQKLNKVFGTNFTAKDIGYTEEGWYNG